MLLELYLFAGLIITTYAENKPFYDLEQAEEIFENFINAYNKTYSYQFEKQERFEIFKGNLVKINGLNLKHEAVFDLNKFSDLTNEEFKVQCTGYRKGFGTNNCGLITDVTTHDAPDSLNWLDKGAVTPVKNQARCGSCWSFSTTGNIEGQYFMKHNQLQSFSEQQLVDCSKSNNGCNGGMMADAMSDIMQLGGLELETDYPYQGKDQTCKFDKTKAAAKLSGCNMYKLKNEDLVKEVVAKIGPLSIAINANPLGSYKTGILTVSSCPATDLDHAVLIVGYGTDNGVDYWLVKNSWASDWGENGYFRMKRGENTCGFMNDYLYTAVVA